MRCFSRCAALICALLLILTALVACAGEGESTPYESEHVHVFGAWMDAAEVASDGAETPAREIRYCKICHAFETR